MCGAKECTCEQWTCGQYRLASLPLFSTPGNSGCSVYGMTDITRKDSAGVTISTCQRV